MIRASRLVFLFVGTLSIALGAHAQSASSSFGDSFAQTAPSLFGESFEQDGSAGATEIEKVQNSQLEGITFYWENDGGFLKLYDSHDRYYTNGAGFEMAWTSTQYNNWKKYIPLFDDFEDPAFAFGFSFRQFMYTPEDIEMAALDPDDRPYSGWLTSGWFLQRSDEHKFDHAQLDVGFVGGDWTAASNVQKFVHRILPEQINPQGWDNQLANELAINVFYQRRWKTDTARWGDLELDAIPLLGFEFGNVHVNAHTGVIGRIGFNLPDNFGPANLREFRDHTGSREGKWGLYGYGRLDGSVIARDIFLDGNTFANSHSIDKKPFVGSVSGGLVLRYDWFRVGYSVTYESERFNGQNGGDSFASLELTASWQF